MLINILSNGYIMHVCSIILFVTVGDCG